MKYEKLVYLDGRQRLWVEVAWYDNGIRRSQRMPLDFEQSAIMELDAFKAEMDRITDQLRERLEVDEAVRRGDADTVVVTA